jgi:hypothetical protein
MALTSRAHFSGPAWWRRLIPLMALLFAVSSSMTAAAADPARTPSGANLREAYPLHSGPTPSPAATTGRPVAQRTRASASQEEGSIMTPIIVVLVVTFIALAAFAIARRGRRDDLVGWWLEQDAQTSRPSPMPRLAIFEPPDGPAAPPGDPGSRRRFKGASPPEPGEAWTAEIAWRMEEGEARFVVAGRSKGDGEAAILTSHPVPWPPSGAAEVAALEQVVGELDGAMLGAGWSELEPGEAWYARRFSWAPLDTDPAGSIAEPGAVGDGQ